jgi:hypothetical protein
MEITRRALLQGGIGVAAAAFVSPLKADELPLGPPSIYALYVDTVGAQMP